MTTYLTVKIPEHCLLQIATYGTMGTGDLSALMQMWAEKECVRLGLERKLIDMQLEKLAEVREGIRNILGDDAMESVDTGIETAKTALGVARVIKKKGDNSP